MDTSKANDLRISSSEGPCLSPQLDKRKENLNFFKDLLQLVDRIETGSKEVQVSQCPGCIRLENKYKCCKARIAELEGKLEKVEAENEVLQEKLNALELLSGHQHSEMIRLNREMEIQKWERFEAETKVKQMVANVKLVNKVLQDILTELRSGESQNLLITESSKENEFPEMTRPSCERKRVNVFAELSIHVNNRLQKWEGMQMKTRLEVGTVFENLKKIEEELSESMSFNTEELQLVELIPLENITILDTVRHVAIPALQMQVSADGNIEIANEINEQNQQNKYSYPNIFENETCENIEPYNLNANRSESDEGSSTGGTHCNQTIQQLAVSDLPPNDKVYDLIEMEIGIGERNGDGAEFHFTYGNSIDGTYSLQINQQEELLQTKSVEIMEIPRVGEIASEKAAIPHNNVDDNGRKRQMESNTDASFSAEVQQQSARPDTSEDKELQDSTAVNKTHYRIQPEGDLDRGRFHCKCGKSYRYWLTLDRHFKQVNVSNTKTRNVFQCNICDKKFRKSSNLNAHIKRIHERIVFPCHLCNRTLHSEYSLSIHLKTHMGQRDHKCDICNKSFVSKSTLTTHKIIHSDKKKHKCMVCGWKFHRLGNLNAHMKTHSNEKPYKCISCGKCFKTTLSLKAHQITHFRERPHKCPVCSASFAFLRTLKIHQRTHTDLRLYSCSQCPRTYRNSRDLRSHLMAHHSPSSLPAFHCIFCNKGLLTIGSYHRHIRAHVGESRVFCELCDRGFANVFCKDEHKRRWHSSLKAI